jgi:hypothetical protein
MHSPQSATGAGEGDILHQRDLWKTAGAFIYRSSNGETLIAVGQPETARTEIKNPQPPTVQRGWFRSPGRQSPEAETCERNVLIVESPAESGQPAFRQAAIGVEEQESFGVGGGCAEVELGPAPPGAGHHPSSPAPRMLPSPVTAASVSDNHLDTFVILHRIKAGADNMLLVEGRDDDRQFHFALSSQQCPVRILARVDIIH